MYYFHREELFSRKKPSFQITCRLCGRTEDMMNHPDRKKAKRFDMPGRSRYFTDQVYSGESGTRNEIWDRINEDLRSRMPDPPAYNLYFGELHGHSCLSDGQPSVDEYFLNLRDNAKLDFAALSDHDHGGVGKPELWGSKWELIKEKVKEYDDPGKFTTILAYERDSYPWYNNLVVYYDNHDGELLRGEHDGELTREELRGWLNRDDLILIPHDTNILSSGADFLAMELEDMTPMIQVYSRDNYNEKFDERFLCNSDCEGGHWQDALKRGAKMGCIAASDDHGCTNGLTLENQPFPRKYPGITGVWAKENTLPALFEALKARRCYGFMGGRVTLDFRINGHYMGEEISLGAEEDRVIYWHVEADAPVDTVTLVKNCRDYIIMKREAEEQLIYDYRQETDCDCYYVRVTLSDGRMAWSSPIWVSEKA